MVVEVVVELAEAGEGMLQCSLVWAWSHQAR